MVRERRPIDEEDALLVESLLVVVVVVIVEEGRSSDFRVPLGESAPVSLLGLMSSGTSFANEQGGGTTRRGRERGEPEDSGAALFFIAFFFSAFKRCAWKGLQKKIKKSK